MTANRNVQQLMKSRPTMEGAGVNLRRAFGFGNTSLTDPFLLLDDFRGEKPESYIKGFPWHPHRGIETITYVLRGTVAHGDSMGNSGVIGAGDVQWMNAGSGIIHQEMPTGDPDGRMYGFQLWANLPAAQKMVDPNYQGITDAQIPRIPLENGGEVRLICGTYRGVTGPVRDVAIQPQYMDVALPPDSTFTHQLPEDHTLLAYVFAGSGFFGSDPATEADNHSLLVFSPGEELTVTTRESMVRFLLISGKPLREPVAWYGPIVMNTQQELKTAFQELQDNTFIKFK